MHSPYQSLKNLETTGEIYFYLYFEHGLYIEDIPPLPVFAGSAVEYLTTIDGISLYYSYLTSRIYKKDFPDILQLGA